MSVSQKDIRPRLFKERISPIQRINHYPVDKIYPLAPSRLFERWIALSTRYPADKFIHGKVGSINFYPPDKQHKHGRSTVTSFTEKLVAKPSKPTSQKKENFPPAAWPVNVVHRLWFKMSISFWAMQTTLCLKRTETTPFQRRCKCWLPLGTWRRVRFFQLVIEDTFLGFDKSTVSRVVRRVTQALSDFRQRELKEAK